MAYSGGASVANSNPSMYTDALSLLVARISQMFLSMMRDKTHCLKDETPSGTTTSTSVDT